MGRETYIIMKRRFESEINQLPIRAAFNKHQFNEMLESWGIDQTKDDFRKCVVALGYGTFIQKKDYSEFKELLERQEQELSWAFDSDITGEGFIKEAFEYELANHEWIINGDIEPALNELGLSYEKLNNDCRYITGLKLAKEDIRQWHKENG